MPSSPKTIDAADAFHIRPVDRRLGRAVPPADEGTGAAAKGGEEAGAGGKKGLVAPFARALDLLGAYTPQERWLGNRELADRTGLPASTVVRLTHTLVQLGLLTHDPVQRRYRLAGAVLALGYGAIVNAEVQRVARRAMREYAQQHRLHVLLGSRDRLDVIVMESASSVESTLAMAMAMHVGVRMGIATSVMGWALLAALPELERYYLLEGVQRRMPREWHRIRRRCGEAVAQVYQSGWCVTPSDTEQEVAMVAAPLHIEGQAPMVLACLGPGAQLTRSRIERELGPRLLGLATQIQRECHS